MSNGAFPTYPHAGECSPYNTFTEMNPLTVDFSDEQMEQRMFAKCEMQLANFKGCRTHKTEFYFM